MSDSAVIYVNSKNASTLNKVHKDAMMQIRQLYEKANANPEKSINNLVSMYEEAKEKLTNTQKDKK